MHELSKTLAVDATRSPTPIVLAGSSVCAQRSQPPSTSRSEPCGSACKPLVDYISFESLGKGGGWEVLVWIYFLTLTGQRSKPVSSVADAMGVPNAEVEGLSLERSLLKIEERTLTAVPQRLGQSRGPPAKMRTAPGARRARGARP